VPKVLVTGGAGFIGSHVADLFLENGYEVHVVDDLSSGKRANVPAKARFHEIGLNTPEFARLVREGKFDVVAHLAGQVDVRKSVADPVNDATINILGTLNLMEAVRVSKAKTRIVFTSTGGVLYGDFNTPPNAEIYPKDPESPYAISKLSIELYLAYYGRVHGLEVVSVRFGNVYGPRQDPHGEAGVVAIFTERLLANQPPTINGDGKQTRDYVFVGDVVRANLAALERPFVGSVNIGTGIETDVNRLAEILLAASGSRSKLEHGPPKSGEQRRSVVDHRRATAELGWRPEISLEDGLKQTVEWFRTNR